MEKSKLKLFSIMIAVLLFVWNFTFLGVTAVSDTNTYEIPELAMTMDIPTSITVITPGIRQSDPIFSKGNFDYIQTMSKFREHDDYFYGKDLTGNFEFEVTVTENADNIENFSKLSAKKQNVVYDSVSQQADIIDSSICKTDNIVYIETSRSIDNSEGRFFTKEYYTIYNNYDLTVKLISNNDNLSSYELELLKSIIDSVRFPEEKKVNLGEVLSASELFCFCLITTAYVILVVNKIHDIKREKYRAQRKQNRMKERMERDAKEKQAAKEFPSANKSNKIEREKEFSENKLTDEIGKETLENSNIKDNTENTEVNNNNTSENNVKQEPAIDLDAAIANFEISSDGRQEQRKKNNKKNKLPFGK